MTAIHCIKSGDGTICLVINGTHYTVSATHPSYREIREKVDARPMDEPSLRSLLNIHDSISHLSEGKVRVSLDESKVWYNDTEFHDAAFCERILRLMAEGQDAQYLINFLNNLGQNPEFRAIMETFKFICKEGMPITPDGCFLGYKGVDNDYYDVWSHSIDNRPDGRRVEYDRAKVCNNPDNSCASGLHVGSHSYASSWGNRVVLVKVNPRDVVSVPNHDCNKMRVCGYWVIKDFSTDRDEHGGFDHQPVLIGEVYNSEGQRVPGATFTDLDERGQFDNDVGTHWGDEEGRTYDPTNEVDDEVESPSPMFEHDSELCDDCNETLNACVCDDLETCDNCGELVQACICEDDDDDDPYDYEDENRDEDDDSYCGTCGEYECIC